MNDKKALSERNADIRKLMSIFSCSYAAAAQVYHALMRLRMQGEAK